MDDGRLEGDDGSDGPLAGPFDIIPVSTDEVAATPPTATSLRRSPSAFSRLLCALCCAATRNLLPLLAEEAVLC